jgi:hypothetical protein
VGRGHRDIGLEQHLQYQLFKLVEIHGYANQVSTRESDRSPLHSIDRAQIGRSIDRFCDFTTFNPRGKAAHDDATPVPGSLAARVSKSDSLLLSLS